MTDPNKMTKQDYQKQVKTEFSVVEENDNYDGREDIQDCKKEFMERTANLLHDRDYAVEDVRGYIIYTEEVLEEPTDDSERWEKRVELVRALDKMATKHGLVFRTNNRLQVE